MTSLPTELLLAIFEFASPRWCELGVNSMRNATQFPYCYADVCRRWRGIMQHNPQWWSHIRVFMDVGTSASIISKLRCEIELTKHVTPIHVFIFNRDKEAENEASAEVELINEIMTVVSPHMARVRKFIIEASHGSSLPLISSGVFSDLGPLCVELTLACDSYTNVQSFPAPGALLPRLPLGDPQAEFVGSFDLTLDGPTFLDFCSAAEYWDSKLLQAEYISLSISHVKTDGGFTEYDFAKAIFLIKNVTSLTLKDVDLRLDSTDRFDSDTDLKLWKHRNLECVSLISLPDTSILRFFETDEAEYDAYSDNTDWDGDDVQDLELYNCNLTSPKYPKVKRLIPENMPAANQNYSIAFDGMKPDDLTILDCPSMDDSMLDILDEYGYHLDSLSIRGKTKITTERLKRFIKYRAENGQKPPSEEEADIMPWGGINWKWEGRHRNSPCVILTLELSKADFPLTKEDKLFIERYMNQMATFEETRFTVDGRLKTIKWFDPY